MNSKGNILKAFKQFKIDLEEDIHYFKFKQNSYNLTYEDRVVIESINERESLEKGRIIVLKPFKIITDFQIPNLETKLTRRLNAQLFKNLTFH